MILARNLLGTLRNRELAQAAKDIAGETGLEHRPVADGQRVAGIYRRSVMLASGRYAMLDDGMGFSLVPWKPVIEQRLGQQLAATVRGGGVSWEIDGRKACPSSDEQPASDESKLRPSTICILPQWREANLSDARQR